MFKNISWDTRPSGPNASFERTPLATLPADAPSGGAQLPHVRPNLHFTHTFEEKMKLKSIPRRVAIIAMAATLVGCATNEFKTVASPTNGPSIRSSKVYAYSFLDLRDSELGSTMLSQIDSQLTQSLASASVSLKVLRFKDSDIGRSYATTNSGMSVPVRQTIESNISEEKAYGAEYRLVIFPSKITLSGAWKFYDIRWDLIDVKTGNRVWSSSSQGKHLTMWKNDEDPEGRAKVIVDGVIAEFKKSGLI